MALTVDLAPELVAELRAMAQEAGLDPDRYVARSMPSAVNCTVTPPLK